MSIDIHERRPRRALLAGLGGGVATLFAAAIGKTSTARAVNGDTVSVGGAYSETTVTSISNTGVGSGTGDPNDDALHGTSHFGAGLVGESTEWFGVYGIGGHQDGVRGTSTGGSGVVGEGYGSSAAAVLGENFNGGAGVAGNSRGDSLDGPPVSPSFTGVFGNGVGDPATGVWGRATGTVVGSAPTGVLGEVTTSNGVGVWGKGLPATNSVGVFGAGDVGMFGATAGLTGYGAIGGAYADGVGLYGSAGNSAIPPVYGGAGVIGQADAGGTAVVGFTGLSELKPTANCGVYGRADTGGVNGRGMVGSSNAGQGILGQTVTGIAIRAYCGNNTGVALNVTGKATFDRSGKLTIGAASTSVTKTGIGLTAASFILATLQTNVAGLYVQSVVTNPGASSFVIQLNKAPGVTVSVAWLAVN